MASGNTESPYKYQRQQSFYPEQLSLPFQWLRRNSRIPIRAARCLLECDCLTIRSAAKSSRRQIPPTRSVDALASEFDATTWPDAVPHRLVVGTEAGPGKTVSFFGRNK